MARKRDPRRDEAYQIWKESNGSLKLKDIAEKLGVADTQVRKWKSQDQWAGSKGNVTNSKRNVTKREKNTDVVIDSADLNEKQQQFCLHYIRHFNATKAYQEAYGCDYRTAVSNAHRMMGNDVIKGEIRRLKAELQNELFIDAGDLAREYMKMAFADINDFLEFGSREIVVRDKHGQVMTDKEGVEITFKESFIHLNDSASVDGTLISEVKQGRDGISLKLHDKQKAMQELSKRLLSIDELKAEKMRAEIEKLNRTAGEESETEADVAAALRGLVNGLNAKAD